VLGLCLALSSTAIVMQLLVEQRRAATRAGRVALSVLLFQDLMVVPIMFATGLLGRGSDRIALALASAVAQAIAVVLLIMLVGRFVLRPLLRFTAKTGSRDFIMAITLLIVIVAGGVTGMAGLSVALGAFLAGLLLSETEFRHHIEVDLEPFKGLLLGLFFMSVGMAANLGLLIEQPGRIALFVTGLLGVKFGLLWLLARLTRHSSESARGMAFALPQAGEFGFVLFSLAVTYRVMDPSLAELLVIVVTISMIVSPLLLSLHENVIEPRLAKPAQREFDRVESTDSRVIIAGFGRFGQIVGRVLRMRRIPFTALELSVAQVDFVRRFGNKVYYGDASRLEVLQAAGAARAEVFVLAIEDIDASVRTAELVRRHFPNLKIMARARNRQHALRLMDLGVKYLIRETYLSSLDLAQHTLEALGLARADAVESIRRFDVHDKKQLQVQREFRDDEQKLIQSAQQAARELEQLFESDAEPTRAEQRSVETN
jgi:glutathione-regulated potassium-efflux system protein KefB